jgi:hypothetical protein
MMILASETGLTTFRNGNLLAAISSGIASQSLNVRHFDPSFAGHFARVSNLQTKIEYTG